MVPPVNYASLRALEAAERRKSYSLAATERYVTHSAISHQIRQLELSLGITLFVRSGTQMLPTPECSRLAARIRRALNEIDQALAETSARQDTAVTPLLLSVMTDFAMFWLIPQLGTFTAQHPEIEFTVAPHTDITPPDCRTADIGIWHQKTTAHGYRSVRLTEDSVICVCSPDFAARYPDLGNKQLAEVPLLRFGSRSWREFFEAAGIEDPPPEKGPVYSDAGALLQAVISGQGAAMIRRHMATPFLARGELVRIGTAEVPAQLDYYVTWMEDHPRRKDIDTFVTWLRENLTAKNGK